MLKSSFRIYICSVYWPYKIWQRQEKDRHQQQQIQNYFKQSKLSSTPSLPSLTNDIGETCERATSPLRMLTPAKRSASTVIANQTTNHYPAAVEITVIERPLTRSTNDRALPSVIVRQNSIAKTGFILTYIFFLSENMILILRTTDYSGKTTRYSRETPINKSNNTGSYQWK